MSANPPQDAPQPDGAGAQPWQTRPIQPAPNSAYPAYPPPPESYMQSPAPTYPPAEPGYAQPPAAPAYPSMPLGSPYIPSGYGQPGYGQPGYPSTSFPPAGYPPFSPYGSYGYAAPVQTGVSGSAIASVICAVVGALLILAGFGFGALAAAEAAADPTAAAGIANPGPIVITFVTGMAGVVGLALSIPAVVTGHIGLGKINRSGGALSGRIAALTGLFLGYIEIAVPVVCIVLFIALAAASANG